MKNPFMEEVALGSNTVGMVTVNQVLVPRADAKCVQCEQPFTRANVFTTMGAREIAISGLCEKCFNANFSGAEQ
jgi:hypothetical protein